MRIADLMQKKNQRVKVRVPAKLQAKLGTEATGRVEGLRKKGKITWVKVKIARRGVHEFRPQDLSAA